MKVRLEKVQKLHGGIPWTACEPFVENSRAVLIHRVRHVTTHQTSSKDRPHLAVHCWCGNGMTGTKKFTFLSAPPDGKLLCARCEDVATKRNMPSAYELTGKHVHLGRLVPHQLCCTEEPQ